jgi:hypothetical protein
VDAARPGDEVGLPHDDMLVAFHLEAMGEKEERQRALAGRLRTDHDQALSLVDERRAMRQRRPEGLFPDRREDRLKDAICGLHGGGRMRLLSGQHQAEPVRGSLGRKLHRDEGTVLHLRPGREEGQIRREFR